MRLFIAIAFLLHTAAAPAGTPLFGTARALDGDTLEVAGQQIRLLGMDAPESDQLCLRDERPWRCGEHATAVLSALVAGKSIRCEVKGRELSGRGLAVCKDGETDLAREMVRQGMAVTYSVKGDRSGLNYDEEEADAEAAQRGLWSGAFVWPEDWRDGLREGFTDVWQARAVDVRQAGGDGLSRHLYGGWGWQEIQNKL